jgi:uncharacterized protein with NRDE domain
MCLIFFAHRAHAGYPLVFAANRDEFHERPTAPADFWADAPQVLAGRDLRAGGTWMGVTRDGRWAALTNVRDPGAERPTGPSRGYLVSDYLRSEVSAAAYLDEVAARMHEYSGFNLLVGDAEGVYYVGNRGGEPRVLPPGLYGLSNHLLDTPWPKVVRGKEALRVALERPTDALSETLFEILARADPAPDPELPDTGVGREWERVLSSLFIVSPEYGTRASTVLLVDAAGSASFVERSFRPGPVPDGEVRFALKLASGGGA